MAIRIAIDTGHGSNTAGKRTPPMPVDVDFESDDIVDVKKGQPIKEHIANVGVAIFLDWELRRCGFEIIKTGWNDENAKDDLDTPLSDRQKTIALADCDYSISIHFNAFGDGKTFNTAEGVGIYIHNKYAAQSKKFAEVVLKHLAQGSKQKNRGVTPAALAMVNCNKLDVDGAILVELAFMTNKREAIELMGSNKFWKECAVEIAKGVCEYTGIKYIQERLAPTKAITPESSKEDIIWAQERLNAVLPDWMPRLKVDGDYGPKTRIAVLVYWDSLGWAKHMKDDGKKIGTSTREALAAGRIK